MSQLLKVEMPDDVVLALQKDNQHLAKELRLAALVKWYELGMLTQGRRPMRLDSADRHLSRSLHDSEFRRFRKTLKKLFKVLAIYGDERCGLQRIATHRAGH